MQRLMKVSAYGFITIRGLIAGKALIPTEEYEMTFEVPDPWVTNYGIRFNSVCAGEYSAELMPKLEESIRNSILTKFQSLFAERIKTVPALRAKIGRTQWKVELCSMSCDLFAVEEKEDVE